jgi:multidrug efflux pump subunit AcrA (membrane-fusion protein)
MTSRQTFDPQQIDEAQNQIRSLVHEIQRLCKSDLEPATFYQEFLQRVVAAVAAIGGVVWKLGDTGRLEVAFQMHLRETGLLDKEREQEQIRHNRLIHKVLTTGQGMLVAPHSGSGSGDEDAGNPTEFMLLFAPLKSDQQVQGVVEIFQRPLDRPTVQRGNLRFVLQMCDMVSEYLTARQLRHFTDRHAMWTQLSTFARDVHAGLDPKQTAYILANEGRRLIECDRVTVAIKKGRKCVVEAVSGQDSFDKRANAIRLLNHLATAATATGEPVWYSGVTDDMAPQVEGALQNYVDESHSRLVAVLPLKKPLPPNERNDAQEGNARPAEVIGALIVEQIEAAGQDAGLRQRAEAVCEHGSTALANAVEHQQLFLMPLWRVLGKATWVLRARTLPKTIAVVLAVAGLIAFLCLFPASFNLEARGTLEPVLKRDVFAALDGNVENVAVEHGDTVTKDQTVVELKNTDLEVALQKAQGDLASTTDQMFGADRNSKEATKEDDRNSWRAKYNELKSLQKSQQIQLALLNEKKTDLIARSPLDGTVVTWQLKDRLMHRPVQRGQVLLTVADPKGPWEVELHMAEDRMGHITKAWQQAKAEGKPLEVTYILATDPATEHRGTVRDVHAAAEVRGEEGNTVLIRVQIDPDELSDRRPGATVTAKVYCGKRPIGYVWLHDAIAFLQSKVLFRL